MLSAPEIFISRDISSFKTHFHLFIPSDTNLFFTQIMVIYDEQLRDFFSFPFAIDSISTQKYLWIEDWKINSFQIIDSRENAGWCGFWNWDELEENSK